MFSTYFSVFRASELVPASAVVFGFVPTANACQDHLPLTAMHKSVCSLAHNVHAADSGVQVDRRKRLLHKPVPGLWHDVLRTFGGMHGRVRATL